MIFEINHKRLVLQLLPTFLRRPVIFGLLRAALVSLEKVYADFKTARAEHNYRLTHNGQVCYLREVLNDKFDSNKRRFDIISVMRSGEWLYAVSEDGTLVPVAFGEDNTSETENVPVVYNEISLNSAQNEFIVCVPSDVYETMLEAVKETVNKYKLITKRAQYQSQSA